jgi:RecA-family ATPase
MAPRGVVIISTEDTPSTTIRPRLEAAGADLSKVRIITEITDATGAVYSPEFGKHELQIEAAILDVDAAFLIVDPLVASLDAKTDPHKDAEVRRNLTVLKRLAQRTGCAVVGLRHFTKAGGTNPLYRGQGSIAFGGAARSVLVAARDPEDPNQRVLAVAKSNLAVQPSSRRYSLGPPGETVRVGWEGESSRTAVELLANMEGEEAESTRVDAKAFLTALLANGPVPSAEIFSKGKKDGYSEKTLRRAKKELGVRARLVGQGRDGKWQWELPEMATRRSEMATHGNVAISDQAIDASGDNSMSYPEMATSEGVAISDPPLGISESSQEVAGPPDSGAPDPPQPAPARPQARAAKL